MVEAKERFVAVATFEAVATPVWETLEGTIEMRERFVVIATFVAIPTLGGAKETTTYLSNHRHF